MHVKTDRGQSVFVCVCVSILWFSSFSDMLTQFISSCSWFQVRKSAPSCFTPARRCRYLNTSHTHIVVTYHNEEYIGLKNKSLHLYLNLCLLALYLLQQQLLDIHHDLILHCNFQVCCVLCVVCCVLWLVWCVPRDVVCCVLCDNEMA